MSKSKRSRFRRAGPGILCTLSLVVVSCYRLGLPLTVSTWAVVALTALSGASLGLDRMRSIIFPAALAVGMYLAVPGPFQVIPGVVTWTLFDDVGGRSGWAITPGLQFGHDGPNTALLESYVGSLEPHWEYGAPLSPYIRDGDERVQSHNVMRYEYFPGILDLLPHDDARRAVIKSLTDTENRLRVHQGLLLACLYVLNYPAGMDGKSWWSRHKELLRAEHDPFVAASLTQGWIENVGRIFPVTRRPSSISLQYHSARYQQQGSWGGHCDFGDAFMEIVFDQRQPEPSSVETAREIVWWPERQTQNASKRSREL